MSAVARLLLLLTAAFIVFAPDRGSARADAGAVPPGGETDPRPVLGLTVKNRFKPDDRILPQVVEARLLSDLADMETFRTVGASDPWTLLLTCTIVSLSAEANTVTVTSRDAESSGQPQSEDRLTGTLDLELRLEDHAGKEVYRGKVSVQASRQLQISIASTTEQMTQELIDRAAQKIERLLRKRVRKL